MDSMKVPITVAICRPTSKFINMELKKKYGTYWKVSLYWQSKGHVYDFEYLTRL